MAGNKFWGGESSDSESDSSASSDEQPAQTMASAAKPRTQMRWAEETSSDEEDTKKRVVKSATDKRFDMLRLAIKQLKNHRKIDDYGSMITDYEAILKVLEKNKALIEQDGGPPGVFVKTITNLENYLEQQHADHQEQRANKGLKLPENKQRAFNTLRAKVRKGNKQWQDLVDKCKEHPSEFESDMEEKKDEVESDSESSASDGKDGSSSSSSDSNSDSDSDSDSGSDSDDNSDSDSDSSSEEKSWKTGSDSDGDDADEETIRERKMIRWLITDDNKKKKKDDNAEQKPGKEKKSKAPKEEKVRKGDREAVDDGKRTNDREEYTPEELSKKIQEIALQRGRRGFDRAAYLSKLKSLMAHAEKQGPRAQLYILSSMVSADFDNTGGAFAPMRLELWVQAIDKVGAMLKLLVASYKELEESGLTSKEILANDDSSEDQTAYPRQQELFIAFVEKLDDELYKALQFTLDVYGAEYMDILGNSSKFLALLKRVVKFFTETKQPKPLGSLSLRLVENLYYKPDVLNSHVFEAIRPSVSDEEKDDWVWPENSSEYIGELCRNVHETKDPASSRRASFLQIYHLSLHNNFQAARDLLHLGNLTEQAEASGEPRIQILNNRAIASIGLCAFRLGKVWEAHQYLMVLCQHNKARELLAQGLSFSKYMDKTPEQERAERLRQFPYHMHINLEVLDTAHQICAMLLEIPNLAMQSLDPTNKQRVISRVLRRHLEAHEKLLFIGPPESPKEAVIAAAKSLQRGDWQNACKVMDDLKVWDHVDPGNSESGHKVKDLIRQKIKTESLRTYMFAFASIYDAFQLSQLAEMFDLEPKVVHSIISKMMIREELAAFWDESSKYVLVQHSEPSHLQRLAVQLADRGAQAVDNNERLLDQKGGGTGLKEQRRQDGQRWDQLGGGGRKGFGKGGNRDEKGRKGKGRGKGFDSMQQPRNRGWENARAGAMQRGTAQQSTGQRGWSTGPN